MWGFFAAVGIVVVWVIVMKVVLPKLGVPT